MDRRCSARADRHASRNQRRFGPFKPFVVVSYNAGRFSPRINLAYQFNGNSVLAGKVQTGEKGNLPEQFLYVAGVDVGVTQKFSLAVDFLGQRLIDAQRVFEAPHGVRWYHISGDQLLAGQREHFRCGPWI
jgi:hypothetical protein